MRTQAQCKDGCFWGQSPRRLEREAPTELKSRAFPEPPSFWRTAWLCGFLKGSHPLPRGEVLLILPPSGSVHWQSRGGPEGVPWVLVSRAQGCQHPGEESWAGPGPLSSRATLRCVSRDPGLLLLGITGSFLPVYWGLLTGARSSGGEGGVGNPEQSPHNLSAGIPPQEPAGRRQRGVFRRLQ